MGKNIIISENQFKHIKGRLNTLIREEDKSKTLRGYSFDWDDNIINMPTKIKMLKRDVDGWTPVEVGTNEFASLRNNKDYKVADGAFDNFIDDEQFLYDLKIAVDNKSFAPSFDKFKESLIYANPISIITARGQSPEVLRKGIDLIISYTFSEEELGKMIDNIQQQFPELDGNDPDNVLKTYLDSQDYHPVTSSAFIEKFGTEGQDATTPEESKKIALRDYVTKIVKGAGEMVNSNFNKLSIGFSDDDLGNINAIIPFIKEVLQVEFPEVAFVVYDTSDGGMNKIVLKQAK